MPLRVPPGRAGRPWLLHRLEVARRATDVLDQKRRTLLQRQRELATQLVTAQVEWDTVAREAADWLARAKTLSGVRNLRLAGFHSGGPASVQVRWRNSLGVVHPADAHVELPVPIDVAALGGSSAVAFAADAHRRALEAAARCAVARAAHDRVARELTTVTRRIRAIEQRWIPRHETALEALELMLDDVEREEGSRVRWMRQRVDRNPGTARKQ